MEVTAMSDDLYEGNFFQHFMTIYDPRQDEKIKHKLIDVLFIVVVAVIGRCDEWHEMEIWAREREAWLRKYLELPGGIPSQYTLERVCDVIDPKQFVKCFTAWMKDITELSQGTIIAIDDKTARGTAAKNKGSV